MNIVASYSRFSGNATELSAAALDCAGQMVWPVDPEKTNERLVRYYVAEGVMDKPDRQGREAAYGYRHLLQLLNARRMADRGLSLSVIGEYNRDAVTTELEENLRKPVPTEAELLVHTFKNTSKVTKGPLQRSMPRQPPMAIPDVLAEVKSLKQDWMKEIEFVKRLRDDFELVRSEIERNRSMIAKTNDHFNHTLEKLASVSVEREAHFMKNLGMMLESQGYELKASNSHLSIEIRELREMLSSELEELRINQKSLLTSLEVIDRRLAQIKLPSV
jgi:DNA-binding transcriptional MerR regulator